MYSRDEVKTLTDKVLNMVKADAAEIEFNGGERSGTRWANSTITTNHSVRSAADAHGTPQQQDGHGIDP
jgi:hypothetical protein